MLTDPCAEKTIINMFNFADISRHFPITATLFQQSLWSKLCIIDQFPIETYLGKTFLEAIYFGPELDDIRSIGLMKKDKILKSGTFKILEVNVVLEEDRPVVEIVCIDRRIRLLSELF